MKKNTSPQSCSSFVLKSALWLCVALGFATVQDVSAQTLVQRWADTANANTRDIAYNPTTGNLLLVKSTPRIFRLNALAGTSAGADMDMTAVTGGTIILSGLAIDTDGVIYGCNTIVATAAIKLYKWDNEAAAPTVLFTGPGTAAGTERQGHALTVYGTGTNAVFIVSGNGPAMMIYSNATTGLWASKSLTGHAAQTMTSGATIVDYNASGFAGKFRILAKTAAASGNLFSVDYPTATSSGVLTLVKNYTAPTTLSFVTSGTHCIDYDPITGLVGSMTRLSAAFAWSHSITATKTGGGTLLVPVIAQTITPPAGTVTDSGNVGGAAWGAGALFVSPSSSGGGAGIYAYDVTPFVISGPGNTIGIVGDASATFTGAFFGGSQLTYQWKSNGVNIADGTKYSGVTTTSLTVSNLTAADTGSYTLTATGVSASTTNASATLTVNNGPVGAKIWNGGDIDDNNWSSADNWSGSALNFAGDSAFFSGSTRLSPVMDGSYDLGGLTFNSGAGAFIISAPSGTLTMGGGVTNDSVTEQTLSLPVSLSGTRNVNAASGNILANGAIGGVGGITKLGANTLKLRGTTANTFAGALAINGGNVVFGKTPGVNAAGGGITFASGTKLTLEASDQVPDTTLLDLQTSDGTLELLAGVNETIKGFPAGGLTVAAVKGKVQLGAGSQLTIAPTLTVGDSAVAITAASPAGTKFIVNSGGAGSEIRFTPSAMVNTFEKVVIINGAKLRCGHGGNAWAPPETMLGAVPASFMQDQISITNALLGLNGLLPIPTVVVNANRGQTIAGNATNETIANVVFPGKITGPGTLWHTGGSVNATTAGGSLELQGLNDFSGGLNLLSGAVIFNNAAAVGSGPITFLNGAARLAASANGIVITNHIDLSAVITNSFGLVNDFTLSGNVDLGSTGSDPQINVTNPANTVTFIGSLTNTLGLVKAGAGKVVLTGNNTYSGPTTVLAGNLAINNTTGSGTSSGAVTVSPGSTLSGIGTIAGTVTVNGTVSPANSVGTLSTGGETWEGGGRYVWEMNDAAGTAGSSPGWDKIAVNGTLQINANSGSKFTIDITSLSGTVGGNAANFNNSVAQEWTILTTTGGINSFDPTAFDLVTTSFSNSLGNANFVIKTSPSGNDLVLALFQPLSPTNLVTTAGGSATFTGSPNTGYTVQYTDSLNPINWQTLTTVGVSGVVTTDGTGVGSFTDPDAANTTPPTERYFRIRYP